MDTPAHFEAAAAGSIGTSDSLASASASDHLALAKSAGAQIRYALALRYLPIPASNDFASAFVYCPGFRMKLNVATCQFPVSSDIKCNARHILKQLVVAKDRGADVAHFPETCLSGYAGVDFRSHAGFDWALLKNRTQTILEQARALKIWVILGSAHRLSETRKPHNSVYIIDDQGRLVDRYDKLFCAGDREGKSGDLAHYTSGNHFSVFSIGGIRCGVLICHDYRYPELYREYKRRGVTKEPLINPKRPCVTLPIV